MYKIEIPDLAVCEEVRARITTDQSAIVLAEPRRRAMRTWSAVWFAFTLGIALGWCLRF